MFKIESSNFLMTMQLSASLFDVASSKMFQTRSKTSDIFTPRVLVVQQSVNVNLMCNCGVVMSLMKESTLFR
jgi:hypothetical protein